MWPISGPASTDTLAAGGGLEVPGLERHKPPFDPISDGMSSDDLDTNAPVVEPIPGAFEPDTLTHRQPGAMGGRFNGADLPSCSPENLTDESTRAEHRREGGGKQGA